MLGQGPWNAHLHVADQSNTPTSSFQAVACLFPTRRARPSRGAPKTPLSTRCRRRPRGTHHSPPRSTAPRFEISGANYYIFLPEATRKDCATIPFPLPSVNFLSGRDRPVNWGPETRTSCRMCSCLRVFPGPYCTWPRERPWCGATCPRGGTGCRVTCCSGLVRHTLALTARKGAIAARCGDYVQHCCPCHPLCASSSIYRAGPECSTSLLTPPSHPAPPHHATALSLATSHPPRPTLPRFGPHSSPAPHRPLPTPPPSNASSTPHPAPPSNVTSCRT